MLPTDWGLESQSVMGLMGHQTTTQAGCLKEEAWCWADTPLSTACCPLKSECGPLPSIPESPYPLWGAHPLDILFTEQC